MKKILSLALALTMLLSLATVLAIPTAAVDGDWHVIPDGKELQPDYDGEIGSLSGYEYTDDGFHTIPTDAWKESTPHVSIQRKEKVDLKEGVYFEVEVNNYTYLSDKWFNMHIWDSVGLVPGSGDAVYGAGVQTLIRPSNSPDAANPGTPGNASTASWFINQFTSSGSSSFAAEQNKKTEAGHPILALTITWDGSTYAVDINGGKAPQAVIDFMNTKWGGNDSEAYIGFNAQNANKGGTVEVTITKFGTSKDTAITPMGDDSAKPTNELIPPAPIADPNTVPANEPAIFMNADRLNSAVKAVPHATSGGSSTINDDFSVHVIAEQSRLCAGTYTVKNEISYDIKDFPIAITLTKNFCTCGNEDGSCDALESANYLIMYGDILSPTEDWGTAVLDMSYNSYNIPNEDGSDDTYLYFYADFSSEFEEPLEGRINGIRFDVSGLNLNTEGGGIFDVMFTAFFRTREEAEAFVVKYLEDNYGLPKETEEPTTEGTSEISTEEPTTESETDKDEVTTEKPAGKDEATTEAPKGNDKENKGGCASVIGFSAIAAVVTIGAASILTFRKKRES